MSSAEIADNPWELSATKPPVGTVSGIAQILMMAGFAAFFGWMTVASALAVVTPPKENQGLAGQFKKLEGGGEAAPAEAAPAEGQ
jgi:hypothetical protein